MNRFACHFDTWHNLFTNVNSVEQDRWRLNVTQTRTPYDRASEVICLARLNLFASSLLFGVVFALFACSSDARFDPGSSVPPGSTQAGGSGGADCMSYAECLTKEPGADQNLAKPVERPNTGASPGTDANTQAMVAVHLGFPAVDPDSPNWTNLGFDLDGVNSTPDWSYHCKAHKAQRDETRQDGVSGIDNIFAHKVVSTFGQVSPSPLASCNGNIAAGKYSLVFELFGIGSGASFESVSARMYSVVGQRSTNGLIPVQDFSAYEWNPRDAANARVDFSNGYLRNHVWVSGPPQSVSLYLPFGNEAVPILLNSAVIQAELDADHVSSSNGVISGAIRVEDFLSQLPALASAAGWCDYSEWSSTLESISEFADIYLTDAGEAVLDPTKECNALSIGLGFSTIRSKLTDVDDVSSSPDPCK